MSTITEIEQALEKLSSEDLARFRQWYAEFDSQRWDRQIEADIAAGKLDALAEEALEDFKQDRCREM